MSWARIAGWEWLLILLIVLGLAVAELISVQRAIRRSRPVERPSDSDPSLR